MGIFDSIAREAIYLTKVGRTLLMTRPVKPGARLTIADWVESHARQTPDSPAVFYRDRVVSYRELDAGANRYARWVLSQGLVKGDVVALMMENRPEYLMAWLGIVKTGAVAALINTHLKGAPLAHCIGVAGAKHIVLDAELAGNYALAAKELERRPQMWATGGRAPGSNDLDAALGGQSAAPLDRALRDNIFCRDKALYIYTSGTTGLPKAANISHMRMLHIMMSFLCATGARASDRMYAVLPLYHSAGGLCAVGPALLGGGSLVLRPRFSATEFWDDCHRYRPTLFQYIGELCRYLLNTPPHPLERAHNLRIAIGNGLRPEIWPRFQERFAIPHLMEFYGATEGNVGFINYDGTIGAIGRIPFYMRGIMHVRLVRFDIEKEIPVRGTTGFCIECAHGEAGEAVGRIDPNDPRSRFDGYTKSSDTEKKILRDVFKKGDAWFRTGDLMRRDRHGYFYFVDRIGDTFRWKGENVATSEVAEALNVFPGIKEANVYGVAVPGGEGRAGMAAIVADGNLDLDALAKHLETNLPSYARPIFLRFQKQIETTSTFKQRKLELVKEGFNPETISDALYVRNPQSGRYAKLDRNIYDDIAAKRMAL